MILLITRIFENTRKDQEANIDNGPEFNFPAIVISSTAEVVGLLIVISQIDSVGRVNAQAISYGLGGITVFAVCLTSSVGNVSSGVSLAILTILSYFARCFEMGASCVTWV